VPDIRRLGPDDLDALSDLSESRSWGRTPQKWAVALAFSDAWGIDDPRGGLLASITVAHYDGAPDALGAMLVRPDHERRGIATALIGHVLADAADEPIHLYATTYGEPLYRRLGFVDRERVIRHAGTGLTDWSAPPVPAVSLGAPDDDGLECLARLDAAAFGADRTPMIEAIGAQPGSLLAVHRDGAAAGIAWHWDDQRIIGPLSAGTADQAVDLVAALARGAQRARLDVHDSQLELGAWCTANGLPAAYEAPSLVRPGSDGVVPPPVDVTYRTLASQGFG